MSGDVQPRKRKDKKRKKDELSVEEHRGTAAVFGEGDVLMHSQHEHGTGGHWCAKIIFFSLLAVLVTLIGLIILENRGLSELEANAVESRYSGVLDGWIEDAPDDDHHDEHTLELKHHEHIDDDNEHVSENDHDLDDNDEEHEEEVDHDDDDEEDHDGEGEDEDDENDDDGDEDISKEVDDEDGDDDEDQQSEADEEDDDEAADNGEDDEGSEEQNVKAEASHTRDDEADDDDDDDDDDGDDDDQENASDDDKDDDQENAEDDDDKIEANEEDDSNEVKDTDDNDDDDDDDEIINQSVENGNDDDEDSREAQDDDEDDEHHEEEDEEEIEEEIEKIEKEVSDQDEAESKEEPLPETNFEKEEEVSVEILNPDEEEVTGDKEFMVADDLDEPAVERIAPPPPGNPYVEIEDVSTETPPDTLAEEEEYEKQQEQLRQEEEQSSSHRQIFAQGHEHMGVWLKLAVGGALLVATHAVVRRATGPRDAPESEQEEHASREETPLSDRRMTLISEEEAKVIPPQSTQPKIEDEIVQKAASFVKATPVTKQESEELDDAQLDEEVEEDEIVQKTKRDVDESKELYSDEDENEADEEVDEEEELEEKVEPPKTIPKVSAVKKVKESEPEEVPEHVEIIDDEQIEEEVDEEVEDEEEISDVDDTDLLSRLEAKYGRLPEPERPGQKHKDGGNSVEDDWPGEPSDAFWREQLDKAEQDLRQGAFGACEERVGAPQLAGSGRARWLRARALDMRAEAQRDNRVLSQAIAAYLQLLKMNEGLSDQRLLEIALRTIDRIKFRGTYLNAEPVYRLLIRRFPNDVAHRNNLTISFLMANRADLASEVLKETLRLWPNDRVALAHYGFILKTEHNKLEEAVTYFQKALEGDAGAANEPRFYYHLGDALLMLGRPEEAHEVHRRGAELGHFLSAEQRSLYNVPRLKSQPWWDVERSPYARLARELEAAWRDILREGEAARALFEREWEGLRERGDWSQLDLFVRGRELPGRCGRAPVACAVVRREPAARCRRGQVKFSALAGGSHVRAHVGPTNCRLRMHLALSNTEHAYLRVANETRQWQVGKVLMFDDSFEHEVWHNGTETRLVLIVDVWHPALTPAERRDLPAI